MTDMDHSDGFRIDFSNVEMKNFDPMPTGKYLIAPTDYEVDEIQNGDNAGQPKIVFEFTVQEPAMVGKMKVEGRKVWSNFFPTLPKTLWNIMGFLAALGYDVEGAQVNFNPVEIMERSFDDRLLVGKIKSVPARKDKNTGQEYNPKNEIQQFYPVSDWDGRKASAQAATGGGSLLP
jgi:hypothetical protein